MNTIVNKTAQKRRSDAELLRIFAMLLIIAHHIAIHSGFDFPAETITINRLWIIFIQMGGKLGVNIFVLISGYFSIKSANNVFKKSIRLWLQLFTYSIAILIIYLITNNDGYNNHFIIKSILPVTHSSWWFASSYFVLLLFTPFINKILNSLSKQNYKKLLVCLLLLSYVFPLFGFTRIDTLSVFWFVLLYSLAGYIRLHFDLSAFSARTYFLASFATVILTYLIAVVFMKSGMEENRYNLFVELLYDMNSVFILFISLTLFLGFISTKITYNPLINKVSSATFGVYLIHDNEYIRQCLWSSIFRNKALSNSKYLILYTIAQIFMVFILCTVVELLRIHFIEKRYIAKIDGFTLRIKKSINNTTSQNQHHK